MEEQHHQQLPSPMLTASQNEPQVQKRERSLSLDSYLDEHAPSKRLLVSPKRHKQVTEHPLDPVAHWASTKRWPEAFKDEGFRISLASSSEQTSTSVDYSDHPQWLIETRIFMPDAKATGLIQKSSQDLCRSFCEGSHIPRQFPDYPLEQIPYILWRIQFCNSERLQRDITPWIVPSAENLYLHGEITPDYIVEEVREEWIESAMMGGLRPKPDYTVGLSRKAFTEEENKTLDHHTWRERPFFCTLRLCFPFLMCEAKIGAAGPGMRQATMDEMERQIRFSASIAIRAIIHLYNLAFGATSLGRVKELYGQVLVFSVSHDNNFVNIYGHYAVLSDDSAGGLRFCRYLINRWRLDMLFGAERHKAYNFVLNIYEKFAPEHRKRIKDAIASLPAPSKQTGLSCASSDSKIEETGPQEDFECTRSVDDSHLHADEIRELRERLEKWEKNDEEWEKKKEECKRKLEEWDQTQDYWDEKKEYWERRKEERRKKEEEWLKHKEEWENEKKEWEGGYDEWERKREEWKKMEDEWERYDKKFRKAMESYITELVSYERQSTSMHEENEGSART